MKWLLDTNILSEQVRSKPDRKVLAWLAERTPEQIAVSAVTIAELRIGAMSASDELRRRRLTDWLRTEVEQAFGGRVLPISTEILMDWIGLGRRFAVQRAPRATTDTLIASTARVHKLIVVSRNLRHFTGTGISIYDPWTDETRVTELA